MLPPEIGVVTGSGATAGFSNMLFNKPRPLVLAGHFFGCIGQMLPAAMGAVAASGNKPHVLCDGDASVMMHLAEFETAVRYKHAADGGVPEQQGAGLGVLQARRAQDEEGAVRPSTTPDLGAVGKAFGGRGRLVKQRG